MKKFIVLILAAILFCYSPAGAATPPSQEDAVNAIGEFLLDRANKNLMAIYEIKLKDNELFINLMPELYKTIQNITIEQLVTSKSESWQKALTDDIIKLPCHYSSFMKTKDGKEGLTCNDAAHANLYSIYELKKAINNSENTDEQTESARKKLRDTCQGIVDKYSQFCTETTVCNNFEDFCNNDYDIDAIVIVNSLVKSYESVCNGNGGNAHQDFCYAFDKRFDDFKGYLLFFVALSKANSKDDIKAVLSSAMLPPVSFSAKRDTNRSRWTLQSYLGLAGGYAAGIKNDAPPAADNSVGDQAFGGLFAPVGFEYTFPKMAGNYIPGLGTNDNSKQYEKYRRPLSIFVSAFDFGPVINAQIYEKDAHLAFKDVLAPGMFFTWGWKKYPLAWGAGAQYSRNTNDDEGRKSLHVQLFLAFDMPLYILY